VVFLEETVTSTVLSFGAILVVVFLITGSIPGTLLISMCVFLVDYFLLALVHFWSLNLNGIVVVNVIIAIGLAVDYSAHIGHTYLATVPPRRLKSKKQIRAYKARKALSQMGSSVFHGAFSTFLAISCLMQSNSYVFKVFYRLWVGIILFGCANGFLLLPVVLSYIGPTTGHADPSESKKQKPFKDAQENSSPDNSVIDPEFKPEVDSERKGNNAA